MDTINNKYIIGELKRGNKKSFKSVYDKYFQLVYYIASHFELQREDSEEVVQEVFMKIWEKREELDENLSLKAYIATIAKNIILKRDRKKVYEIAHKKYHIDNTSILCSDTEDSIIYSDLQAKYEEMIRKELSESQREIYLLNKQHYKTAKQIAEQLNLSLRTVENQLYRANKILKEKIKSIGITIPVLLLLLLV